MTVLPPDRCAHPGLGWLFALATPILLVAVAVQQAARWLGRQLRRLLYWAMFGYDGMDADGE